jgi:hypothetical protein
MSKEIDWEKPLSDEDREYALQRNLHAQVQANDARFGDGEAPEPNREERIAELRGLVAKYQAEINLLEQEQAEEVTARNASAVGDFKTGNVVRDQTGVDGEAPEGSLPVGNDYTDSRWTVDALKAEIVNRNGERAKDSLPPLSLKGTKAELIERLQEDDESLAVASDGE